jgi:hypothetical protein
MSAINRPARPSAPERDAPTGGPDFDWPPADSPDSGEFVTLDDAASIVVPQSAAPLPAERPREPRSVTLRRKAGPGEELVWPPPGDELEAVEIGGDSNAPTVIVPAPRPRPRGPRIDTMIDRPRQKRQPTTRPTPPAAAAPAVPAKPPSLLEREPPTLLQAAVLGLAVVTAGALGIWAIGSPVPTPAENAPPVANQPLFRAPARPQLPVRQIDEMPMPAFPWPLTPGHGANAIGEPLLADVQPPRADEPIAAADTSVAHHSETAPSLPAGIFDPAFVPAGHPVTAPGAPPTAERPQP